MKITIFGGTGGLGSQILKETIYADIQRLGSEKVNLRIGTEIDLHFQNYQSDILIFFNNSNFNSFLHKCKSYEIYNQIQSDISGTSYATTLALKSMREKGYGRIIYASSVTVDKNVMGTSIYAAKKAYYENLVRTIAIENASKGITANCIQLGYMDGGLTYTLDKTFLENKIKEIPAQRLGTISEIDKTIRFLIDNEYVNGSVIKLTGGL